MRRSLRMVRRCSLAALPLALASASAQAHVWTVDAAGNGDFLEIQAAVDVAVDGDLIVVSAGTYPGFTIERESLAVVVAPGAVVGLMGTIGVRDLRLGQQVLLEGFETIEADFDHAALELSSNAGSIRVLRCHLEGLTEGSHVEGMGTSAARVASSADVVLEQCTLEGGDAGHDSEDCGDGWSGASALSVAYSSRVSVLRSVLVGGRGGDGEFSGDCFLCGYAAGGSGGAGAAITTGSFLFAAASSFQGGPGGVGETACDDGDPCGDGGTGLRVSTASAALLACTTVGGAPGGGHCSPGEDVRVQGGSVEQLVGSAASLEAATLVQQANLAQLTFRGVPGERVAVLVSSTHTFHYDAAARGVLHVGEPSRRQDVGVLDANGELTVSLRAPTLGITGENLALQVQAVMESAAGQRTLTNPLVLHVVR